MDLKDRRSEKSFTGFSRKNPFLVSSTLFPLIFLLIWVVTTRVSFNLYEERITTFPHPYVIIVLGGEADRMVHAASLAKADMQIRMLSTCVDTQCLRTGLSPNMCATGVRNTIDEAVLMHRILLRDQIKAAIIVTSRYHAVRASSIFTIMFAGTGIQIQTVAPLSANSTLEQLSIQELVKYFPSVGGTLLARFTPDLYEWIRRQLHEPFPRDALAVTYLQQSM